MLNTNSLHRSLLSIVLAGLCATDESGAQEAAAGYVRIAPGEVQWKPLPSLPKGAQIAVLHGHPAKPGLFTLRVKLPANYKVPVHSHPDERVRTIISGTYYSALGDKYEALRLVAFSAGTFSHVAPRLWQFAETRDEEVVFEVTGVGPTGIDYLDPADDPRRR